MQTFGIEESKTAFTTKSNTSKDSIAGNPPRTFLLIFTACLGFASTGYHLIVPNSAGAFIWHGFEYDSDYSSFRNRSDLVLAFSAFLTAALVSLNRVKFIRCMNILIIADIIMIIGTSLAFLIINNDSKNSNSILLGKALIGIAIGINATIILPFIRETQFYLPRSNSKPEIRTVYAGVLFALGIFLGITPTQVFSEVARFERANHVDDWVMDQITVDMTRGAPVRPQLDTLILLSITPFIASAARIMLFICIGDIKPPKYTQVFTDDGFVEDLDAKRGESGSSTCKLKGTKSIFKLFEDPYRRGLELCYLLKFQVVIKHAVFLINSQFLVTFMKIHLNFDFNETPAKIDTQNSILGMVLIYLVVTLLVLLILIMTKPPRKYIIGFGSAVSGIIALVLGILNNSAWDAVTRWLIRPLIYVYWAAACVSFGPTIDLFIEEVLPAKGVQFLQMVTWLLISILGVILKQALRIEEAYTPLFFFFAATEFMTVFGVCAIMPETYDLRPNEIYKAFGYNNQHSALSTNDRRGSNEH